jgi:hydroxymethylpyrimidine kinase/phosphomethylpyrimidine kinase/thiamine-phosphate diphosphorylase
MALGYTLPDAVILAKAYINQGMHRAIALGHGKGPLRLNGWPVDPENLPWLTEHADQGESRMAFPDCGNEELGLYPLVDSLDWLKKLLPMGIQTIQLRIKDGDTATVESVIDEAVQLARKYQARLFINDYWKLAIKTGAYGVHLGQEDLVTADLTAIQEAGLRPGWRPFCLLILLSVRSIPPRQNPAWHSHWAWKDSAVCADSVPYRL